MEDFKNLYDEMFELFETFQTEHTKFVEKGNAAAATRARGAIQQLKKLITSYKKSSVALVKEAKEAKKNA